MTRLYVDGAAGTVGLALAPYLQDMLRAGVVESVSTLPDPVRKDQLHRQRAMAAADLIVLCLPDEAAPEAVALVRQVNPSARILDASAAHRCDPDWVYGLAELTPASVIQTASLVANPGCFATGAILLARPLRGLLAPEGDLPWVPFQGVTGYSAGGREAAPDPMHPWLTQLGVTHRHLAEIQKYGGVTPALTTLVGSWERGMIVQATLPVQADAAMAAYEQAYQGSPCIQLARAPDGDPDGPRRLSAQACNGTNDVRIVVAGHPHGGTTVAAAYDNLGKGAAGSAALNLWHMCSLLA